MTTFLGRALLISCLGFSLACGDEDDSNNAGTNTNVGPTSTTTNATTPTNTTTPTNATGTNPDLVVPSSYSFESRFEPGQSSVSYGGQVGRNVLLEELKGFIKGDFAQLATPSSGVTDKADFLASLNAYYLNMDLAAQPISIATVTPLKQSTIGELADGKDLKGKLAGQDSATDHKDWSTQFVGWDSATIMPAGGSPDALVQALFDKLATQAEILAGGGAILSPDGDPLPVWVTPEGHDLQQLIQKFLYMGIHYSQATDDYLDDDVDGKGLKASNAQAMGKPYSPLEHAWDEGFGYFGAARNFGDYTDNEISNRCAEPGTCRDGWGGYHDTDGDMTIDLMSEYVFFGAAQNAAKRDLGSAQGAKTDFTKDAFDALVRGRAIIAAAGETLTPDQATALAAQRDAATDAWEAALAATALHYANDTLAQMAAFDTPSYDFTSHAKFWSELKGFGLGLQFNPRSKLSQADFERFHTLIGSAPVLAGAGLAEIKAYRANLRQARGILVDAYNFAPQNVGDDDGNNGW